MSRLLLIISFALVSSGAWAQDESAVSYLSPDASFENESELIKRIIKAYGGEDLLNLQSWVIKSKYKVLWPGSYRVPDVVDDRDRITIVAYDRARNAGSFERWEKGYAIYLHNLDIVREGEGDYESLSRSYDLTIQEYEDARPLRSLLNSSSYFSPFLLAQTLKHPDTEIQYLGPDDVDGKSYEILEAVLPGNSTNITLYINSQTHLIERAIREIPGWIKREYFYSNYQVQNGITVAGNVSLKMVLQFKYSDGFVPAERPVFNYQGVELYERDIAFNMPIDEYLVEPEGSEGFAVAPSRNPEDFVDQSQMTATKLSDTVYHVGQGPRRSIPAYSIFIDAGDYIIASGGYPNLKARFEKFKEASGIDKPLGYQVITHHFIDHVSGIPEAYELGAKLVTVAENVDRLKSVLPKDVDEDRFVLVSDNLTIGENASKTVEVYEISTGYAKQLLMLYLPDEKIIFLPGHVSSPFKTGLPGYDENHEELVAELGRLGLDIEKILEAQGVRVFTLDELLEAVAQPEPDPCYNNRPICADLDLELYAVPYLD